MSTSTKSIRRLLELSYLVAQRALPEYSHSFSKKTFTVPQLFSCLVLKTYLKADYRGVSEFLEDFKEARELIGLKESPHFTTLHKASARILEQPKVKELFKEIFAEFEFKKTKKSSMSSRQLSMELDFRAR